MNRELVNRIEVKNLSVSFKTFRGTVHAVRDVSFSLASGETLGIVGESGSGKSVTCKSLMRLLPKTATIDSGEILFDGKNVLHLNERDLRKLRGGGIGMIFQDPMTALDPTMQIGKQIEEALVLHTPLNKSERQKRVLELLEMVGIPDAEQRRRNYPHEFSGGQRQRIVIAAVLAANPKVLIADEPTTALDVTMQAQILELLKSLQQKIKMSIIFITHDLGVIAQIADRIAVMYAGKIIEIGRSNEVFKNPQHPYTWGLLKAMPANAVKQKGSENSELYTIQGTPPGLIEPIQGDAFAPRNEYALAVDDLYEPPLFQVTKTHFAATWLLDPRAPKVKKNE